MLDSHPQIFTTGAYLKPMKIQIDGKETWMWVVSEFIDDSFADGEVYNPLEFAENEKNLLENTTID